jgi:alanine racemase
MRGARAVINLCALRHNYTEVRARAPHSRMLAIVKANAYGHGLTTIARALGGADGFGVACVTEALALRAAGISKTIVSLQGFKDKEELTKAAMWCVDLAVHSDYQLQLLRSAPLTRPVNVWLKIDTGMARLGFAPRHAVYAYYALREIPQVRAVSALMTHLARADEPKNSYTQDQLALFERATAGLAGPRSIANSAAILIWPESHREWVRPGIMLYGATPIVGENASQLLLKPVMTVTAPLLSIKQLNAGDTVGYAGAWVCPEPMTIGVAAIGYSDGYPRHARAGTPVLVNGRRGQLIGRVCMDTITVDLRGCEARVGDEVILWGERLSVDEIARCADTVGYDLLCAVGGCTHAEIIG